MHIEEEEEDVQVENKVGDWVGKSTGRGRRRRLCRWRRKRRDVQVENKVGDWLGVSTGRGRRTRLCRWRTVGCTWRRRRRRMYR